jgi:general secretion pathway protein A
MKPFSISPNPNSLYLTPSLKTVISKVRYTVEERQGLTCILGDVGMGKSSLLRLLYAEYQANELISTCFIPTPSFTSEFAFLKGVCNEFKISPKRSLYDQEGALQSFLLAQYQNNKNVVVFIDEAQRLNGKMLEQVRAMLNFETNEDKLIQIILAGQLELRDRLKDPTKKAIRSRIFAPSLLAPLSYDDTKAMIEFRCKLVDIPVPFAESALKSIYDSTGGIPREVLKLAALSYELSQRGGLEEINQDLVEMVKEEVSSL